MASTDQPAVGQRSRHRLRPIALLLWLIPVLAGFFIDTYDASAASLTAFVVAPTFLAALVAGWSIGGQRGRFVAVGLVALAAYWGWWFGWGVDSNISPFSLDLLASGLVDAASYHLVLLVLLWPLALAALIAAAVVARRRGRRASSAVGLSLLAFVALAFPSRAFWSDGCNTTDGASPLITRPIAEPLMDRGIGILGTGSQTLALCSNVGDREWKPFWLGGDGLPARKG